MQAPNGKNSGGNYEKSCDAFQELWELLVDYNIDLMTKYDGDQGPIKMRCACGRKFIMTPNNYKRRIQKLSAKGYGMAAGACPKKCTKDVKSEMRKQANQAKRAAGKNSHKRVSLEEIKRRIIERHGFGMFDLSHIPEDAIVLGKYPIICNMCNYKFKPRPNDFYTTSKGCPACVLDGRRLGIEGIRQFVKRKGITGYEYPDQEYINNRTPIDIICKRCTRTFKCSASNHFNRSGCVYCAAPMGEQKILERLEHHGITFKFQKPVDHGGERPYEFDFYLPRMNAYIEFDGRQHFIPVEMFGGEEAWQAMRKSDTFKNDYCYSKRALLRIPHNQEKNIPTIVKGFLDDLELLYKIIPRKIHEEIPDLKLRVSSRTDAVQHNLQIMLELQEAGSEDAEHWINLYNKYFLPDFESYWETNA